MATFLVSVRTTNSFTGGEGVEIATDPPTAGDLIVFFYGLRDSDDTQCPLASVSEPSGGQTWNHADDGTVDLADLRADMEFHLIGARWLVSDGTTLGTIFVTSNQTGRSWWLGMVTVRDAAVSDWDLIKLAFDGSASTNVASIPSGSTGELPAGNKVAIGIGTSRTNLENLSHDSGFTSFTDINGVAEVDAGSANYIISRLETSATTAINLTTSEANGASRMASAVLVFAPNTGTEPESPLIASDGELTVVGGTLSVMTASGPVPV